MNMHPLNASQLMDIWERGYRETPAERALTLIKAASPEESSDVLAQLTVGRRDARLLRLRELIFGSTLSSVVVCPACGETLEFTIEASDVLVESEPPADMALSIEGVDMTVRLPTAADVIAVANTPGRPELGRRILVQRCMLHLEKQGVLADVNDLSDDMIAVIGERLSQADPQADIQLAVDCPACEYTWDAPLDIVTFFWAEIDAWARRTIHEVHTLATAYGWRETDILAMSAWRRQLYLQMVSV